VLTAVQYRILKRISPAAPTHLSGGAYQGKSKIQVLLGPDIFTEISGKTVIDFGCGNGVDAIEIAKHGASRVIGIDIREELLLHARRLATAEGVICEFVTRTDEKADVIISLDSFEHFDDPAATLLLMTELLASNGRILASFGPTWYHPFGGHLFSVFPWAHLIFSERALIRWRSDIRQDGATKFSEVAGGLNLMTIKRFIRIVNASPLEFERLELVPIRKLKLFYNRFTREFCTAIVRCTLVKRRHAELRHGNYASAA